MPTPADFNSLIGTFIDSWSDGVAEPYQNLTPILADAPFGQAEMVGGLFHQPTRLTYEGGQTFAPASVNGTAVLPGTASRAYVGPRAGQTPDAQIQGMQIHGRSRLTYEAIARSMKDVNATGASKKKAVQAATKTVLDGLMEGTLKKVEALMLHGQLGLGQLDTSPATLSNVVANTYETVSGFACDLAISAASWSEAMWLSFEGHTFDLFADSSGVPTGSKLNTAANTLLDGTSQNGFVLISVNPATPLTNAVATGRVLRMWHSSGTAGATGTGVLGGWTTPASPAAATQHLTFESGGPSNEFAGIGVIGQNTGTLFNISAATYSMWRGNIRSGVGNIRLAELVRYMAPLINAGAQGKKIRAVVPTELFTQFANDESTLRRYAAASPTAETGFSDLLLYLPHRSTLEILGHGLQKDGLVMAYVPDELKRVGSQDLSFVERGSDKNKLILEVAAQPTSEVRLYGQFAPFVTTPRHCLYVSGVTF